MKADPMAEDELPQILQKLSISLKFAPGKLQETTVDFSEVKPAILAYTTNKIIEELAEALKVVEEKNDIQILNWFDDRLAELKALNHRKDDRDE